MPSTKTKACTTKKHPNHQAELSKINRISGQILGVKKMVEEQRYCPDILTQLRAIRAAVQNVEANILEAHLDACVSDALACTNEAEKQKKMDELKTIYRRFTA